MNVPFSFCFMIFSFGFCVGTLLTVTVMLHISRRAYREQRENEYQRASLELLTAIKASLSKEKGGGEE